MPDDAPVPVGSSATQQAAAPFAPATKKPISSPVPPTGAVPTGAVPTGAVPTDAAPPAPFPASPRTLSFGPGEFAPSGEKTLRLRLTNDDAAQVLHVRVAPPPDASWLRVTPTEAALGPGENQTVLVRLDLAGAHQAVARARDAAVVPLNVTYQRLFSGRTNGSGGGGDDAPPAPPETGTVYVRLPVLACPSCGRSLGDALAANEGNVPEVCPFCFERLRACPVCGTPNSWLAERCELDPAHVVRAGVPWAMLGGGPEHAGSRSGRVLPALSRRWSFPSVPPLNADAALAWSAPVAAYGLVAAAAATAQGEAHLYAFDAATGAPLWEPYPLPDPVYPERGGAALADGRLYAATVEGVAVCVDALRGARVWETPLGSAGSDSVRVYGAVVPARAPAGRTLVLVVGAGGAGATTPGHLFALDGETGRVVWRADLAGPSDTAPAVAHDLVFVHDDGGTLAAFDLATGEARWRAACGANFDAAPLVCGGLVISPTRGGSVFCHDARTGEARWQAVATSAPLAGTPAHDGTLIYLPGDDGLHIVSASQGRAVRRYGLARPVRSAPIVVGGTLFFGATDGRVYGVEAGRSQLQTLYETGASARGGLGTQIVAPLAWENNVLFAAATNGVLYALAASAVAAPAVS